MFARCAADAAVRPKRFRDIAQQFHDAAQRVCSAGPVRDSTSPIRSRPSPGRATLGDAQLGAAVRLLTYRDETASLLPLLIHEAQVGGRPQALAAQYLMIQRTH